MKLKLYTFTYEQDGETWTTYGEGYDAENAVEHIRFWWPNTPDADKMKTTKAEQARAKKVPAFYEENILRAIYADKEAYLQKVDTCDAGESDKEWMRRIIRSGEPKDYIFADTVVRELVRSLPGTE